MEYLKNSYEKIINSSPEILKEIEKEVSSMNNIALHNLGNAIARNSSHDIVNKEKLKAVATTLVRDLIFDILYKEEQED